MTKKTVEYEVSIKRREIKMKCENKNRREKKVTTTELDDIAITMMIMMMMVVVVVIVMVRPMIYGCRYINDLECPPKKPYKNKTCFDLIYVPFQHHPVIAVMVCRHCTSQYVPKQGLVLSEVVS
jgi:heme/copper-type cytochrome/quinol oxidase subunit 2